MREVAVWGVGSILAFLLTAAAFLLLANLAPGTAEESLTPQPGDGPGRPGATLDLDLNRSQLASLEPEPDQGLDLTVKNDGARDFSEVTLTLAVSSDDTARPRARYYRRTIKNLPSGKATGVRFDLDLSGVAAARSATADSPEPRGILEVRATTPEGASAVRTAIVPL